jgi:hypothetical protein
MQTSRHFPRTGSRRQSKRIPLKIDFEIHGHDENGIHFSTHAQCHNVSREGGCLLLDRNMPNGEILKLKSPKGQSFIARVCWSYYDNKLNLQHVGFRLTSNRGWVMHEVPQEETASIFFNRFD